MNGSATTACAIPRLPNTILATTIPGGLRLRFRHHPHPRRPTYDSNPEEYTNQKIQQIYKGTSTIRVGAEHRVTPSACVPVQPHHIAGNRRSQEGGGKPAFSRNHIKLQTRQFHELCDMRSRIPLPGILHRRCFTYGNIRVLITIRSLPDPASETRRKGIPES